MAKKEFTNIGHNKNLKGGGAANILGEKKVESSGGVELKESKTKNEEPSKDWYPQTFNVYKKDYIFFQRYSRYMALKNDEKYNLMRCFNDAMDLLREKYPDIEP